jgi:TolB-like protein/Tfp pilus assembly protein PilF
VSGTRRNVLVGVAAGLLLLAGIAWWAMTRSREKPGRSAATDERSIAVLPFVNMSSDKEQEYFSEGISEELLNLLSRIPGLKVAARTSSFSFKGKGIEIPEIARQLRVAHVLEGSVRKSGERVRITAQLIHAADGFQRWSQTYDRELDDIFRIQDEISADVVRELEVTLLGAAPKARETDPEAYALYLQAAQLERQGTAGAFAQSDALYRRALAIDPRYAPAQGGLATNFYARANLGLLPLQEGYALAREAAEKALELDPEFAPAHARLGALAVGSNDFAGAATHLERALARDPANPEILTEAATLLTYLGRPGEALAIMEFVVRRDPVNLEGRLVLGDLQLKAGRLDAAIASYRTALSLSPGRGLAHYRLGLPLLLQGDAPAALAEFERETSEAWRLIGLPMAYYALGRGADSDAALAALIAKYGRDTAYNIAFIHAYRGDTDRAFEWLGKAVEYGDSGLPEIMTQPLFDELHSDPRWLPFARSLGLAPEQVAQIDFHVELPE